MADIKKNIPAVRRQQILDWLAAEGSLSIRELEKRLGISHMTVHRDLDKLAEQNLILKVRSGAVIAPAQEIESANQHLCIMCARRISRRSEFIIMRQGQAQMHACCPHCGLMLLADLDEVETALTRDFLYGQMVNVFQAHYVIGSDVRLCCVPTILCFSSNADAQKFSRGFGGRVMDFSKLLTHLTAIHQHDHHQSKSEPN